MRQIFSEYADSSVATAQVLFCMDEPVNVHHFFLSYDEGHRVSDPSWTGSLCRGPLTRWSRNPFSDDVLKRDVNGKYRLLVRGAEFHVRYLELMRRAPGMGKGCVGEIVRVPRPLEMSPKEHAMKLLRLCERKRPFKVRPTISGAKILLLGAGVITRVDALLAGDKRFTKNGKTGQWLYHPFDGMYDVEFCFAGEGDSAGADFAFHIATDGKEYVEVREPLHLWHISEHHLAEGIADLLTYALQEPEVYKLWTAKLKEYWNVTDVTNLAAMQTAYAEMEKAHLPAADRDDWLTLCRHEPLTLAEITHLSVRKGFEEPFPLRTFPASASSVRVTVCADNAGIAQVIPPARAAAGGYRVKGIQEGTCRLRVFRETQPNRILAECTVNVYDPHYCRALRFRERTLTLAAGDKSHRVSVMAEPSDASDAASITYTSSNAAVARVKPDGSLEALRPGMCTIRAAATEARAEMTVQVLPLVSGLVVSPAEMSLTVGKSGTITYRTDPPNAYTHTVKSAIIAGKDIISMSGNTVTALAIGKATVTYEVVGRAEIKGTCRIIVKFVPPPPPPDEMSDMIKAFLVLALLWWLTQGEFPVISLSLFALQMLCGFLMLRERRRNVLYFLIVAALQFYILNSL